MREDFSRYSRSENTYNINLHPRSLNLVARRFYDSLFGIKEFDRATIDTPGFASIIKSQKSERTFQELLDVLYYNYLLKTIVMSTLENSRMRFMLALRTS